MSSTAYQLHGAVAVITLDNPPVNGLGYDLRRHIVAGVSDAQSDDRVQAVILIGSDRAFSGGADIREFGSPKSTAEPRLDTVIRAIEASVKPVIAAIGGVCMGGGLELALGCHFRVAVGGAQIALPEVKLGLLPGAGGTQRLPRLIGVEAALEMIVSGTPSPSEKLKGTALFDAFIEGGLLEGALAYAARVIAEKPALKRVRDINIALPDQQAFFRQARDRIAATAQNFPAPLKCVEAVAAAVEQAFEEGLKTERKLFLELMAGPESRALRHAFFAERACAKIAGLPEETATRKIGRVAVIGAGAMGGGIAMNFLDAGIPVTLLEMRQEALDHGVNSIRKNYQNALSKGKLAQEKMDACMALLAATLDYQALKDADLAIEAVAEDIAVKESVFRKLDEVIKPGAILATSTSAPDLDRLAGCTKRPQDVIGMRFLAPANVTKLLEVVRGAATAGEVLATVMQLAKKLRKTAVLSGLCKGFIGQRMFDQYLRAANTLVEDGASPKRVNLALENWGMAKGPFHLVDYGQRAREAETPGRAISDAEIVERCIYALVNEAARLLDEGIAQRASDIDMVFLIGYGFPRHRGGPLLYADETGLAKVLQAIAGFAVEPAPLLVRLAAEGRTFN